MLSLLKTESYGRYMSEDMAREEWAKPAPYQGNRIFYLHKSLLNVFELLYIISWFIFNSANVQQGNKMEEAREFLDVLVRMAAAYMQESEAKVARGK